MVAFDEDAGIIRILNPLVLSGNGNDQADIAYSGGNRQHREQKSAEFHIRKVKSVGNRFFERGKMQNWNSRVHEGEVEVHEGGQKIAVRIYVACTLVVCLLLPLAKMSRESRKLAVTTDRQYIPI